MSLQTQHLLEFGEFRLDLLERRLQRGDAVISITPKVFDTLQVLVENAGHLVEKDELMQRIWHDRFVEESNLAFNIKMLRKALGDDAASPRFIETVPRRGYRFVADVREGIDEKVSQGGIAEAIDPKQTPSGFRGLRVPVLAVLLIAILGIGWWYVGRISAETNAPILSAPFSSESLSSNSRVLRAVISPDGKNVAYTSGLSGEKQSVWLRQLDSSNNVQIIPPSDEIYFDLAFSPDGNFLYFVRGPKPDDPPAQKNTLSRISVFGGTVTKIVDKAQGEISVSADGKRISFVRCPQRDDEWCSLWIADADGGNERKLVSRLGPFRIGDNEISPDGRTVAFCTGQSRNGSNDFGLAEVDIESGVQREITTEKFFDVKSLIWLPDRRGLLFTALKNSDRHFRIWHVSADGKAEILTKDSEDYSGISTDKSATTLVATKPRPDLHLNLYAENDLTKARRVSDDIVTAAYAPDGKLIVAHGGPGNVQLWSVNTSSGEERQLTTGSTNDLDAVVSPDGASVFFVSNRTGDAQIWRMKADGSDQRQVTVGEGGSPLAIGPAGKWIYYHSALGRTLKRVSVDDRQEQVIVDKLMPRFAVSHDCSRAAFPEGRADEIMLKVVSLPDGNPIENFRINGRELHVVEIAWANDGRSLYYITQAINSENRVLWIQPLSETAPRKIGDLPGEGVHRLRISPDGKGFAIVQGTWKHDAVLIKGLK